MLADCKRFVANTSARAPTDFNKEFGAKANSYWGDPIYCTDGRTVAQVIRTLPAKGVAASVDICKVLAARLETGFAIPNLWSSQG